MASAIPAFLIVWILAASDYDVSKIDDVLASAQGIEFLAAAVLSVLLGVVSAIFYSSFENKAHRAELERIYRVGPSDLVSQAIQLLQQPPLSRQYKYLVEYTLLPANGAAYFKMRVRFSYEKTFPERDLFMRVIRHKTAQERIDFARNQSAVDALYRHSELFFYVDEVGLREKHGDDVIEREFFFNYVKIDGSKVELEQVPGDPHTQVCRIADSYDLAKPISFEYCFEYAAYADDIVFTVVEFPTKGLTVKFSRDPRIQDAVSVDALEMMSATQGAATIGEDTPGEHIVKHPGWVLAKSGAVFHWYLNDNIE